MKKLIIVSIVVFLLAGNIFVSNVKASEYNLKEMTPAVEAALVSRKGRFDTLESLKAKGIVGENNKGYVELLVNDPKSKDLVNLENIDRKIIYKTIAEQNGIENQLFVIEKVFAQVQHEKASNGYLIQKDDGSWVTK